MSEIITTLCVFLEVNKLTKTAYGPETNGQAERYNCIIVARVHQYVSEHQSNWDTYIKPLTYAYNTQTHRMTETSLFNISLPREPPSGGTFRRLTVTASDMPRYAQSRHAKQGLLERVALMKPAVGRRIAAIPKRYNTNYNEKFAENHRYVLAMNYTSTTPNMLHLYLIQQKSLLRGIIKNSWYMCADHLR